MHLMPQFYGFICFLSCTSCTSSLTPSLSFMVLYVYNYPNYSTLSDAIVYRHMIKINDGLGFHHNVVLHPFLALFLEG